jgi:hypothetical protein
VPLHLKALVIIERPIAAHAHGDFGMSGGAVSPIEGSTVVTEESLSLTLAPAPHRLLGVPIVDRPAVPSAPKIVLMLDRSLSILLEVKEIPAWSEVWSRMLKEG